MFFLKKESVCNISNVTVVYDYALMKLGENSAKIKMDLS